MRSKKEPDYGQCFGLATGQLDIPKRRQHVVMISISPGL